MQLITRCILTSILIDRATIFLDVQNYFLNVIVAVNANMQSCLSEITLIIGYRYKIRTVCLLTPIISFNGYGDGDGNGNG